MNLLKLLLLPVAAALWFVQRCVWYFRLNSQPAIDARTGAPVRDAQGRGVSVHGMRHHDQLIMNSVLSRLTYTHNLRPGWGWRLEVKAMPIDPPDVVRLRLFAVQPVLKKKLCIDTKMLLTEPSTLMPVEHLYSALTEPANQLCAEVIRHEDNPALWDQPGDDLSPRGD